jgi:polyhydroxyalkanoate synthesis repressor PhaR
MATQKKQAASSATPKGARTTKKTTQQANAEEGSSFAGSDTSRVIKKYPNRRLYDTQTSAYVTLADIKKLVMDQTTFQVLDAKTGEDLTRNILMQIILEEESGGMPIFSTQTLSQIIRFYGHSLQGMMSPFLENNLSSFVDMQNKFAAQSAQMGQTMTPESWFKFMQQNSSSVNDPMANYVEQGKKFFEQMQNQTSTLFGGFPFAPNSTNNK